MSYFSRYCTAHKREGKGQHFFERRDNVTKTNRVKLVGSQHLRNLAQLIEVVVSVELIRTKRKGGQLRARQKGNVRGGTNEGFLPEDLKVMRETKSKRGQFEVAKREDERDRTYHASKHTSQTPHIQPVIVHLEIN